MAARPREDFVMLARDVMTREVATVAPETPVRDIARMLVERHISAVPVVDGGGRLVGIVSEGDLMRREETGSERRPPWWLRLLGAPEDLARAYVRTHGQVASDVMSREVTTVAEDASLGEVAALLEDRRIKRVPVVSRGRVVGIVSRADLVRALAVQPPPAAPAPAEDDVLRERVLQGLRTSGVVGPAQVNVIVSDGTVHLWGVVRSREERDALRLAASGVPGVRDLRLHVGVVPVWTWAE